MRNVTRARIVSPARRRRREMHNVEWTVEGTKLIVTIELAAITRDGDRASPLIQPIYTLLDDDTVRTWFELYQEDGIEGLANFGHEGGACRLTAEQQDKLKAWIAATLPRTTREVGAWIARAAACPAAAPTRPQRSTV